MPDTGSALRAALNVSIVTLGDFTVMEPSSQMRSRTSRVLSRLFVVSGLGIALAACNQTTFPEARNGLGKQALVAAPTALAYAAVTDERFPIPAVSAASVAPQYRRQRVRYDTVHPAGTLIVDPGAKFLYLVLEGGYALRYGIGVGREGFGWTGTAVIRRKAKWPTWTPPSSMIARQPELKKYRNGMEPGIENPLGARALYLFQGNKDTLYRIHGTNEPESIGQNVSSGCIRLVNQEVIDLFNRVPSGTKVVVLADPSASPVAHDQTHNASVAQLADAPGTRRGPL